LSVTSRRYIEKDEWIQTLVGTKATVGVSYSVL